MTAPSASLLARKAPQRWQKNVTTGRPCIISVLVAQVVAVPHLWHQACSRLLSFMEYPFRWCCAELYHDVLGKERKTILFSLL